jgi:hypothetical protein
VAATGAQIHRGAMRRPQLRLPTRNPIQIGAGGAGVVAEVAARGPAVRRVQAVARPLADVRGAREWPGIEWTSGALA